MMKSLYNCSYRELGEIMESWGEPSYRLTQLWNGLYRHYYAEAGQFTVFPHELRDKLRRNFNFHTLTADQTIYSKDRNTQKVLFRLEGGEAIETVLMHYDDRQTLCISSQSGCAAGCGFCATGQMGFKKHLTAGEIVEQVVIFSRQLAEEDDVLTNVVFMGMGEPFHNYQAVMDAIHTVTHDLGMNMGARRITVSTVGFIPGIEHFTAENTQLNLAVSLHAVDNDLRSSMIPINDKYPIEDLMKACAKYVDVTNRRITFEWALINRVNDSRDQAVQLADLLQGMLAHVNLIQLNPIAKYQGEPTADDRARKFQRTLLSRGIPCTIRLRRGFEIQAGCGQLASSTG